MPKKCAVIEYSSYTNYTLPSVIYYLQNSGYEVDLFISMEAAQADFLALLPLDRPHIYVMYSSFGVPIFSLWEAKDKYNEYDLLFINTLGDQSISTTTVLQKIMNFERPMMVWRRYDLPDPQVLKNFYAEHGGPLHFASQFSFLNITTPDDWLIPAIYQQNLPAAKSKNRRYISLYIDNFTGFHEDGFKQFYEVLRNIVADLTVKFKISIFADVLNPELINLRNIVQEDDLQKFFIFRVINPQTELLRYYAEISQCDCGLYLKPIINNDQDIRSLSTALIVEKPLFAPEELLNSVGHHQQSEFSFINDQRDLTRKLLDLINSLASRPAILNIQAEQLRQQRQNLLQHRLSDLVF